MDDQSEPGNDNPIQEWDFDDGNLSHLAARDIDAAFIRQIAAGEPRFVRHPPREDRSSTHWMIGPAADGRYWTIAIRKVEDVPSTWRPITGWPSNRKHRRIYHEQAE